MVVFKIMITFAKQPNHGDRFLIPIMTQGVILKDKIITGFLSIYVPMNLFLYVYKMSFVDSLIYSLPFVVACILVVAFLTFSKMRFSGDKFLR